VVVDSRLEPGVTQAMHPSWRTEIVQPTLYPLHFACPVAVAVDAGGLQSGAVEPWQPTGGAVAA
jgi:hypothetical protein